MKRLLIAATLVFAFSATSAMAAPIPHGDDDPGNWGAVYNLDLCGGQPCEFSATSTDLDVTVLIDGGNPQQIPCTSLTLSWELDPHATVFDWFDVEFQGATCPYSNGTTTARACVYSPSGFANGADDVELWIRHEGPTGQGLFAKAPDDAVGNYVYRFASYEFDQQAATGAPPTSVVFDGTFEVDGDPVLVEHDRGATSCDYQEL